MGDSMWRYFESPQILNFLKKKRAHTQPKKHAHFNSRRHSDLYCLIVCQLPPTGHPSRWSVEPRHKIISWRNNADVYLVDINNLCNCMRCPASSKYHNATFSFMAYGCPFWGEPSRDTCHLRISVTSGVKCSHKHGQNGYIRRLTNHA